MLTINNSMDIPSYERNLEIARGCEWVLPTFGVHPWNAPEYAGRLGELEEAIAGSPMLGEIGLDHHFVQERSQFEAQRTVLTNFLAAAAEQDKIVNLHTKGAEEDVLRLLDRYGIRRAIVHWYSGPLDVLAEMVTRGFYFTVGVEVLRSDHIRAIARTLPSDRILTETDNPGGWKWLTGKPGIPRIILDVVETVAALRCATPENIMASVRENLLGLIEEDSRLGRAREALGAGGQPVEH
jgi:TatD DNase family protein